jgi:hypothetical protein
MGRYLDTEGWQNLEPLSAEQVAAIRAHFAQCGPLPGYIPGRLTPFERSKPYSLEDCEKRGPFACYSLRDVLAAPHLLDRALAEEVIGPVRDYLGADPVLYSANAFWTFPRSAPHSTQIMHRDFDGERFVALFVSLTDNVEQWFLPGSHTVDGFAAQVRAFGNSRTDYHGHKSQQVHDDLINLFPVIRVLAGPAGQCALTVPSGLHAGVPSKEPRLLAWFRYGTGPNRAYMQDKTEPVVVPGREPTPATELLIRGE